MAVLACQRKWKSGVQMATEDYSAATGSPIVPAESDEEEKHYCPFGSIPCRHATTAAITSCNFRPMWAHFLRQHAEAAPTIILFIDSAIVYVLSKEWYDLFSIYIFHLQPEPFCSQHRECRKEAALWIRCLFSLVLLLALTVVKRLCARWEPWLPSLAIVPAMCAMSTGWAFGDVASSALDALAGKAEGQGLCSSCNLLSIGVCFCATVLCALSTLLFEPLVSRTVEAPEHVLIGQLLRALQDFVQLAMQVSARCSEP